LFGVWVVQKATEPDPKVSVQFFLAAVKTILQINTVMSARLDRACVVISGCFLVMLRMMTSLLGLKPPMNEQNGYR
jgi:uncharacterized protein (UPF0254 family)